MKKAAKVFLVIGMILSFYIVVSIIFGIITIKRINSARDKSELVGWGIVSIFFVSVLGGIFTLCIRQEELDSNSVLYYKPVGEHQNPVLIRQNNDLKYIENIKQLKELLDCGAITQEEYDQLKAEQLK